MFCRMNFIRWLQSARNFTSNDSLKITDVFPASNLNDDFGPVADFKNEQAVANLASISGIDTRVGMLETAADWPWTSSFNR